MLNSVGMLKQLLVRTLDLTKGQNTRKVPPSMTEAMAKHAKNAKLDYDLLYINLYSSALSTVE